MSKIFLYCLILLTPIKALASSAGEYWGFVHAETGFTFELDKKTKSISVADEVFEVGFCSAESNLHCFSVEKFSIYVAFPKDLAIKKYASWKSYGRVYCVMSSHFDNKSSDLFYVIYSYTDNICGAALPQQMMIVSQKRGLVYAKSIVSDRTNSFVSVDNDGFGAKRANNSGYP